MPLGLDFDAEARAHTPARVRRFYREWGRTPAVRFRTFANPGYDEIVVVAGVAFGSLCAHHLLPFHGRAHVGYLPGKRLCGLSKLARVVDASTRRPTTQEAATVAVASAVEHALAPRGVMVVLEAEHDCMTVRGVQKHGAVTVTSAVRGVFADPSRAAKDEFLTLIGPYRGAR